MKLLRKLTVGTVDSPVKVSDFRNELDERLQREKEDAEHFDRDFIDYRLALVDDMVWLVGIEPGDLS